MVVGSVHKVKKGILLLAMSLMLSSCETEEEAAENHLKKGVELLEKGDYAAAQLELKSAKKGNKSTAETYYYLALLDEKAKHFLAMEDNLQKTLKLEPEHPHARHKLGSLQLMVGKTDLAHDNANRLLLKNPQDNEALVLKASVLLREKDPDQALVFSNQVLESDPANIEALTLKSLILIQQNELADALVLINKALSLNEQKPALHFLKIRIHSSKDDVDAVLDDYLTLIRLYPDNDDYKVTLAKIYTKLGKIDAAESLLRNFVEQKPNQTKPKILLLEFLTAIKADEVDQQIEIYTKTLAGKPRQFINFAIWMLAKGKIPEAQVMLNQIVAQEGNSKVGIRANILLAKVAFDTQKYEKVKQIATSILEKVPNQLDAKILKVRLLLVEEQYPLVKASLDKIIWSHPKSDEALVLLAQYYLVQDDKHKAQTTFKAALEVNPANIQAFIPVYESLVANNDLKYARKLLDAGIRKEPRQAFLLQKLIQINILEKKWSDASRAAKVLAQAPKQKKLARFYQANILQGQGECNKAIILYKDLATEFPEQLRILQSMSSCYEKLGQRAEMIKLLKKYIKEQQSISATLVLSDLYAANKDYRKIDILLNDLVSKKPEIIQAQQKLAKNYTAMGQPEKGIDVYLKSLDYFPGNIRLSLSLATLYEQQKDFEKSVQVYEDLLKRTPDLLLAKNNLATLLVDNFPSDESFQRALILVQPFAKAEQAYYLDTYGWTLLHTGKVTEAISVFKKLIVKSPKVPIFRYHLGVAEYKHGNKSSALVQIDQAIKLSKKELDFLDLEKAKKLKIEIINKMQGR